MSYVFGNFGATSEATWKWNFLHLVAIPQNAAALDASKKLQAHLVRLAAVYKLPSPGRIDGEIGPSAMNTYNALAKLPLTVVFPVYPNALDMAQNSVSLAYILSGISGGAMPAIPSSPTPAPAATPSNSPTVASASGFVTVSPSSSGMSTPVKVAIGFAALTGLMLLLNKKG